MTKNIIKPVKFTEHFFQLGTPFFPVYLSVGEDAMLIEGGTGGTLALVKEQLNDLGIDLQRIKYIALTHSHADHIGLVPHLIPECRHIKLLASRATAETLANEKMLESFLELDDFVAERLKSIGEISELPPKLDNYQFKVDTIVEDKSEFDLGNGIKWTIHQMPGHSHCHVAFFEEKEGTFAVGDAAGLYFPKVDAFWPEYFASLEQYCSSIRKLSSIPASRVALSHFGVVEGDSRVFLRKSLKATEAYHNEMLARTEKGEDPNAIAEEKANWVLTNHNYMTYQLTEQMCKLLIKRSQKDADKSGLFAEIA